MKKGFRYTLDDYDITTDGKIINKHTNHEVKSFANSKGYLRVVIGGKRYFVHRLVAEKYIPNPYNKEQVNHIDGNKNNNCVDNLEWVTNLENRKHALENNLHITGEKCPWSKLKNSDVIYIREHKEIKRQELADMFNISVSQISAIWNNKMWKYV